MSTPHDPDALLADLRRGLARLNTMAGSDTGIQADDRTQMRTERRSALDRVLTTVSALLDAAYHGTIPAAWSAVDDSHTRCAEPDRPSADQVDTALLRWVVAELGLGEEWREVPADHHVLRLVTDAGEELRFRDGDAPLPHGTGQPGRIIGEGWLGPEKCLLNQYQRPFIRVSIDKSASRAKIRSTFRHRLIRRYRLWREGLLSKQTHLAPDKSQAEVTIPTAPTDE
ncbi:hypothetical protein [Nocardia transvalensis]|uniref:hypothetical protein n=1 Tax=Nocardia transvalensis TaxID=37333 RepID=UPI0018961208|nr:hypothetical protein [Nocardia transvalensis]MBF6333480.1 hypothetical protein [Nocardia transvalensis]